MTTFNHTATQQIEQAIHLSKTCLLCKDVPSALKEEAITAIRNAQLVLAKAKNTAPSPRGQRTVRNNPVAEINNAN